MSSFIGLDIGTTGVKSLLVNEKGKILSTASAEYPLYTPYPLWSEQEPEDWWQGTITVLRKLITQNGIVKGDIKGIGLTGQMHGAVFLDNKQQIIRRALLWNDQRTAFECQQITSAVGDERLIEIAGNPALTGFQLPKILWLRNKEPELYARLDKVLLPKDYIRLMLTGEFATDCSDAAGTLLLDLRKRDWSREILQILEIPLNWLPQVYEGSQITGNLLPEIAKSIGLPTGLPVIAGGGDNAAAAVGTGIVRSGLVSSSIGTSGVVFAHSEDISLDPEGRLHTFCHAVPGKYHLMAVTLSAGNSFRWLRDTFQAVISKLGGSDKRIDYEMLTKHASGIAPGCDGLIFLPYLTGERTPHLDPLATGMFVGLTSRHTMAHMIRAVMEGVIFSLRDGLEIMRGLEVPIEQIRAIGGGGKNPLWCQMQADIFGCEVVNLEVEEGPAFGAALLAIASGNDSAGVSAVSERCVVTKLSRLPDPMVVSRYQNVYDVYHGLYSKVKEDLHKLTNI
jgi:xylulokinase